MQQKYADAVPLFEKAVALDPKLTSGMVALGVTYAMTGQQAKSDQILTKLNAIDSTMGLKMQEMIKVERSRTQKSDKKP